jgi:hypothetical protein
MESNGGQQGCSTEPTVAQKGTQDRSGEGGGETTKPKKSNRGLYKKIELHKIPKINATKTYRGNEVRSIVAFYREQYYAKNRELLRVQKSLKKHKAKKKSVIDKYIERQKETYRKLKAEKTRTENLKKTHKKKLLKERKRVDEFIVLQKREIRKQERNKLKYKYTDPDRHTNPRNYNIITWIRVYTKINTIRYRTKLKPQEVLLLLWIYSNGEGNTKSSMWKKDTGLDAKYVRKYSVRLVYFNLIAEQKVGTFYKYDLTERGNKFLVPIIEFVKQQNVNAKRLKRKFVRDRVRAAEATAGIQDGGVSVQQEGAVL